jgi:hypothetical protein
MTAQAVVGINHKTAEKLDKLWANITDSNKVVLHVAYNLCCKRKGYEFQGTAEEIIMNGDAAVGGITFVRTDFFRFMEANVASCTSAETLLAVILEWGKLTPEEQENIFK